MIQTNRLYKYSTLLLLFLLSPALSAADDDICEKNICVKAVKNGSEIEFFATNSNPATLTVSVRMNLENMTADLPFPVTVVVPPGGITPLVTLKSRDTQFESAYGIEITTIYGDKDAVHLDAPYNLPFKAGSNFAVLQGANGEYSHRGLFENAIDWYVPEGTEVLCSRSGTVVKMEDSFSEGGPDKKFMDKLNYVMIEHADGTVGAYLHLRHRGVTVKTGQKVITGQLIGYSGNTGYSGTPHLHFHVEKPVDGRTFQTLSFKYRTVENGAVIVEQGKRYTATSSGLNQIDQTQTAELEQGVASENIVLCNAIENNSPREVTGRFGSIAVVNAYVPLKRKGIYPIRVIFSGPHGESEILSMRTQENSDYASFWVDMRKQPSPRGNWRVKIFVGESLVKSLPFSVH